MAINFERVPRYIRDEIEKGDDDIARGRRGRRARQIQEWLNYHGFRVAIDEDFGPAIRLAAQSVFIPGYRLTIDDGLPWTNQPTVTLRYAWNLADNITHVKFSNDGPQAAWLGGAPAVLARAPDSMNGRNQPSGRASEIASSRAAAARSGFPCRSRAMASRTATSIN